MRKLIRGIVEFRNKRLPEYRETFARLALGQMPKTLFIACSDSRVAVNVFASTDPGDVFVVRNVGNIVPRCGQGGIAVGDRSEAAAIEFALLNLNVNEIIVCGHSECGAMQALANGRQSLPLPNLKSWLSHSEDAIEALKESPDPTLAPHNRLSQLNVLMQLEHLKTYPIVQERLTAGKISLHGWWFELKGADVYAYDEEVKKFVIIDEKLANKILARLGEPPVSWKIPTAKK